ncbi:hypothetical protein M9Y10_005894 [Tritrichomonas musculus]|uniref:Uncharacterized protein n=1 Tax=Tritrichomonas musculus TaxID=1915356 RepID=A0ABR2JCS6_9EUKA
MSLSNQSIGTSNNLEHDKSTNKNTDLSKPILIVRAKWSWGGESKILKLDPFDPVRDAMRAAGFSIESTFDISNESNASDNTGIILKRNIISPISTTRNIRYYSIQELPKPNICQDETKIFYICNGKILNDDVSFDFQGIKNGMTIIAHTKVIKKNKNEKKIRFLQSIRNSSNSSNLNSNTEPYSLKKSNFGFNIDQHLNQYQQMQIQIMHKAANEANIIDQSRRSEISRLNDLAFNAWETMPEYPALLKEMLKNEEEEEDIKNGQLSTPQRHNQFQTSNIGYDFINHADDFKNSTVLNPANNINDQPLPNPFIRRNNLSGSSPIKSMEGDFTNVSHAERKNHLSKTYKKQNKSE